MATALAILLALGAAPGAGQGPTSAPPPYRRWLSGPSVQHDNFSVSQRDIAPGAPPFTVRRQTLRGGKQAGVEIVVVDTESLSFTVIPTRGMSIRDVRSGDVRLGWDSPVEDIVHPQWIDLGARGGLGWLQGFNEWLVRCGLEWAGHPGRDTFIDNAGNHAEMDLTLHGRIGNLPASEVELVVDRVPPYRIRVRGRVDERMFHGPKLILASELSVEPGSRRLHIADTVTNRGAGDQEFQVIYHANYGTPLLGDGARFRAALDRVTPFNDEAVRGLDTFAQYGPPRAGFIEQVYCLRPRADADGRSTIMLEAPGGERGVAMSFLVAELPYVTLWKNTAAVEDGYVTGLEPGTGFPANRKHERAAGRVPRLGPGASRTFTLDVEVLPDRRAVTATAATIAKLQGDRPATVDRRPETTPRRSPRRP